MLARLRLTLLALGGVAAFSAPIRAQPPSPAQAAFDRGLLLFRKAGDIRSRTPSEHEEISKLYRSAAQSFVEAWTAGAATTEVFTNAANAYYFAGATGESVLFYKRALSVDPANQRAADALEHIRERLPIKKPAGGAGASILTSLFFWHDGIAFRIRKMLFLIFFPGAMLCFTIALVRRRPFLVIGILAAIPAVALFGSVLVTAYGDTGRREGVLLVEIEGRRGNGRMYSPSHSRPFPPGTEVTLAGEARPGEGASGSTESWVPVRLLDGAESWIPARAVERVLP